MPCLPLLALLFLATPVEEVRTLYADAVAAYREGNATRLLEAAEALLTRRPGSPNFIYLAAAGEALRGDADASMARLTRLADMGLALKPAQEPAFESLSGEPAFESLASRFESNASPAGDAEVVVNFDDGRFVPESVVLDPPTGRYFIGSVTQRRIVMLRPGADPETFVAPGAHGLMSVMGMRADPDQRQLLVATTGAAEAPATPEDQLGRSGIFVFDLDSADLIAAHLLPDDGEHWLGDLVVGDSGAVWATDSKTGEVWRLALGSGQWTRIVPAGTLSSPQGMAADEDGDGFHIADYTGGLWHLDRATGSLSRLQVGPDINAYGIDGLYRHGRDLIAVQNGHRPQRVTRFVLDNEGRAVVARKNLASGLPEFDDPTLGTIVDGFFYFVANSHWPAFDADKNLPENLSGPIIMRIELD